MDKLHLGAIESLRNWAITGVVVSHLTLAAPTGVPAVNAMLIHGERE